LGTFFQVEQLYRNLRYPDFNAIIPVFSTSANGWLTLVNIRQMILAEMHCMRILSGEVPAWRKTSGKLQYEENFLN
jgi:hypothetical protein